MVVSAGLLSTEDVLLDETLPGQVQASSGDEGAIESLNEKHQQESSDESQNEGMPISKDDLEAFEEIMRDAIDVEQLRQALAGVPPSAPSDQLHSKPETTKVDAGAQDDNEDAHAQESGGGPGPSAAKRRKMEAKRAKRAELRAMGILPSAATMTTEGDAAAGAEDQSKGGKPTLKTSLRLFASWTAPKPVTGLLGVKREEWVVPNPRLAPLTAAECAKFAALHDPLQASGICVSGEAILSQSADQVEIERRAWEASKMRGKRLRLRGSARAPQAELTVTAQESPDNLLARLRAHRQIDVAKESHVDSTSSTVPRLVLIETPKASGSSVPASLAFRRVKAKRPSPHEPRIGLKPQSKIKERSRTEDSSVTMWMSRIEAKQQQSQSEPRRHSFWAPPRNVPGSTRRPSPIGLSGRGHALGWPSSRPGMRGKSVKRGVRGYRRPYKIRADKEAFAKLQTITKSSGKRKQRIRNFRIPR